MRDTVNLLSNSWGLGSNAQMCDVMRRDKLKFFSDRWTQTDGLRGRGGGLTIDVDDAIEHSPRHEGKICTPIRMLRRTCSLTFMNPIGEDGLARVKTQHELGAQHCFLNHMLPTLATAFSTHNIKIVVEMKQTNNILETIVTGISNTQFANSDTVYGAAAIINLCSPTNGEACLAVFLPDNTPLEIGTLISETVSQITASLCILVIAHPTGKFPEACIPSLIREKGYPVKIESRNTTEPDIDVSMAIITLRSVVPGPIISIRPNLGINIPPTRRGLSCPTLVPSPLLSP